MRSFYDLMKNCLLGYIKFEQICWSELLISGGNTVCLLGLCSNAVDHKQPMLCESIRHHRRDLALALLTHCRMNEERIEEVLNVILEKERYSFMSTNQVGNTTIWIGAQESKKNRSRGEFRSPIYH